MRKIASLQPVFVFAWTLFYIPANKIKSVIYLFFFPISLPKYFLKLFVVRNFVNNAKQALKKNIINLNLKNTNAFNAIFLAAPIP
ncbi:MAG TPA: hypothetical protein VM888_12000 [Chitinophagaceae bacterium]|nr:hypothetical protein [Chitinophagaceae bacterium]